MAEPIDQTEQSAATDIPWHAAYPNPKKQNPTPITRQEVLSMLHSAEKPGRDFVLVDLRRSDHEVPTPLPIIPLK